MKKGVVKFCVFLLLLLIFYLIFSKPNYEFYENPATCDMQDGSGCGDLSKSQCLVCSSKGCGWCSVKHDDGSTSSSCVTSVDGQEP